MQKYMAEEMKEYELRFKIAANDDVLIKTLEDFVFNKFTIVHGLIFKEYFDKLGDRIFESQALINARMIIAAYEGDYEKSQMYRNALDKSYEAFAGISSPFTSRSDFHKSTKTILNNNLGPIPLLSLTIGRPSIMNGFRDFTPYGRYLEKHKDAIISLLDGVYGRMSEEIYELALAETLYQQDRCYEALVKVVSIIPLFIQEKELELLFVALYLQIVILVINGQVESAAPIMESIKKQMRESGHNDCALNIEALEAWAAMYDGDYDIVLNWLNNGAPDELGNFNMFDIFRYKVKMRVYLITGMHMPIISLAHKLIPILEKANRYMDMCEIYMLLALSNYVRKDKSGEFSEIEKALKLAKYYGYDRILADEGKRMYELLSEYIKSGCEDKYTLRVQSLARNVARRYPKYLAGNVTQIPALSKKEIEVLGLMSQNMSNAEIADLMDIKLVTVKFHASNIFRKLDAENRMQAVEIAKQFNVI